MLIYSLPQTLEFTKSRFPGWGMLMATLTEKQLKAADLREILGLTYRQLNDWDSRGILRSFRDRSEESKADGWRKFSIIDVIALSILSELKRRGIPVSALKNVVDTLFLMNDTLYSVIPNIFYGIETYFYSDLDRFTEWDCADQETGGLNIWYPDLPEIGMLVLIPISRLIENIFQKLSIPGFSAAKNEDGVYAFTINDVPLALEQLEKNPTIEKQKAYEQEILNKLGGK